MIITTSLIAEFAADVRRDLALPQKQLQSKYLYDALGSSLFEAICRLPWYRITRAESALLTRHAAEVVAAVGEDGPATIVELGCGSGEKLALLAEALQAAGGSARVHLIDISAQALEQTEQRLTGLRHFSVVGHQSTYEVGLRRAAAARTDDGPMLVLLLGSNIGNFDAPAALDFLRRIRLALRPEDLLLLGADLVKPERELQLAYADPLGVTAAFNKNLLVRINHELRGSFDLDAFDHLAVWNRGEQRVEMHLVSRVAQTVAIGAAGITVAFEGGEYIWTESSYKYQPDQIERMAVETGFGVRDQWIDDDAKFALSLMTAI
ncbi:MAG: L-histidine N(alpha)-methyltransferase [Acidobacteriota bacterium]|nr:L-histidine N(alpha)-methyltransferase [Acidobacteriota bacterium]